MDAEPSERMSSALSSANTGVGGKSPLHDRPTTEDTAPTTRNSAHEKLGLSDAGLQQPRQQQPANSDRNRIASDPSNRESGNRSPTSHGVSRTSSSITSAAPVDQSSGQNGHASSTPANISRHSSPSVESLPSSAPLRRLSSRQKLGIFTIFLFSVGTAIILAALGFLWFLWAADGSNDLWYQVMARNWLTKAVNIISEAIKFTVNFQVGAEVAMIAGLALESLAVLLPHAASFSMMKACASSGTVLVLLRHQISAVFRRRARATILLCVLVTLLSIVYAITQLFSVLLISDTDIRPVRGLSRVVNTTFGSSDSNNVTELLTEDSTWLRAPTVYPAFAEYSEPPFEADGVLDTGKTLRAFLPFHDLASRETIQAYNGSITILDARVTCQRPIFSNLSFAIDGSGTFIKLSGQVSPSVFTPRMISIAANATDFVKILSPNGTMPFNCISPIQNGEDSYWGLSICELGASFVLSEFFDLPQTAGPVPVSSLPSGYDYGMAYLVLNGTLGGIKDVLDTFDTAPSTPAYSGRAEWLDLAFTTNGSLVISATLCYAPWAQAALPVQISSVYNRTESVPTFDFGSLTYTYDFLRQQYGQYNSTLPQRGILQMQNQSWIATPAQLATNDFGPWLRLSSHIGTGTDMSAMMGGYWVDQVSNQPPWTGMFFTLNNHRWLVQEILQNNGSVAFMLQSLITLMSSMTFYDSLGGFDKTAEVSQTFFVLATVPVTGRGMITVITTLALHFVVAGVVLYFFLARTMHSRLGGTWAALAQGSNGVVAEYLRTAHLADDEDVETLMRKAGQERLRVGTMLVDGKLEIGYKKD